MMFSSSIRTIVGAALFSIIAVCSAHSDYKIGPQDKLRVRVYEWRPNNSQVHEWNALTGEFFVGADGALSLPLLGNVPAADRTPSELAAVISERLQSKIGLTRRPDAAVEVVQYRPYYILGGVDKPGEYPYRPGMTVLEAIGIAGGFFRSTDLSRVLIANEGELRAIAVDRNVLLARQARLEAELDGRRVITFQRDLRDLQDLPSIAKLMHEEELLFAARRETLRSQLDSLAQLKDFLDKETQSLSAKGITLDRQLSLAKEELESVSRLVDRGLAVTSRRLALEQNKAQFESAQLDLKLAKLRAQQAISRADRDIAELHNRRRTDGLADLAETRSKLAVFAQKKLTLEKLILEANSQLPSAHDPRGSVILSIVRRSNASERITTTVQEGEEVQPGDVISVELLLPQAQSASTRTQ
jgi:polysaccharide biosynthesis/export protein ExoF